MNQSCLFGAEPCAVADVDQDFLLLIYRKSLKEQCVIWIMPFNGTENISFSKRLVETYPHHSRHYAVGWMIIGSDFHLGVVDKPSTTGAVTDTMNYDLLSMHPSCTLMWLPYQAGEKMPPPLELWSLVIMRPMENRATVFVHSYTQIILMYMVFMWQGTALVFMRTMAFNIKYNGYPVSNVTLQNEALHQMMTKKLFIWYYPSACHVGPLACLRITPTLLGVSLQLFL